MSEEKKSIFEKAYNSSLGSFLEEEKEQTKNKIKREYEIQFDCATDGIIRCKKSLHEMLKDNLSRFDLNKRRETLQDIVDYEMAQKDLKEDYLLMFGEKLNR